MRLFRETEPPELEHHVVRLRLSYMVPTAIQNVTIRLRPDDKLSKLVEAVKAFSPLHFPEVFYLKVRLETGAMGILDQASDQSLLELGIHTNSNVKVEPATE